MTTTEPATHPALTAAARAALDAYHGARAAHDRAALAETVATGAAGVPHDGHAPCDLIREGTTVTDLPSYADHRDDLLDGLYLRASTQLDGLCHRRHHVHGFYNRTTDGLVAPGLLHTGWAAWYLDATPGRRDVIRAERRFTGLNQDREVLASLWDHHFAAVVSDTYALEALPARPDSPFGRETDHGMMRQQLIAMLGLAIGELWRLTPAGHSWRGRPPPHMHGRRQATESPWRCRFTCQRHRHPVNG